MMTAGAPVDLRKAQIKTIKAGQRALGLDDETYRDLLEVHTGKRSAADLTLDEGKIVIEAMRQAGFDRGGRPGRRRGRAEETRQQAMVRRLWGDLYALGSIEHGGEEALNRWLERTCGVSARRFLKRAADANKAIEGLKDMLARDGCVLPDAEQARKWNIWRTKASLPPLADTAHACHIALIEAQWRRLIVLGAMRTGGDARLDTWLRKIGGVAVTYLLSAGDAERAVAALANWIRRLRLPPGGDAA